MVCSCPLKHENTVMDALSPERVLLPSSFLPRTWSWESSTVWMLEFCLQWSCVGPERLGNPKCCELMNTTAMLCAGDSISSILIHPLVLTFFLPPLCGILWVMAYMWEFGEGGLIKMSHLGLRTHNNLFSVPWPRTAFTAVLCKKKVLS